jgi:outer membrane protein
MKNSLCARVKIGFIILIFFLPVFAQEPEKIILSMDKIIELALSNNPQIKIAEKECKKADAGVMGSYSAVLPSLDASVNLQHAWAIQQTTIPNFIKVMLGSGFPGTDQMPDYVKLSFGLENTFTYGAVLRQPLFLGGAGLSSIKMAYAARRAAEQNLQAKKDDLRYESVNAFYGCLLTKELVKVQEEALAQTEANRDVVLKKYDVGMASGFDKMRAEVEVANQKPNVISARNNYQMALTRLRALLGLNKDADIEVVGEFAYQEDEFSRLTLAELQDLAFQNRPELMAMNEQKYMTRQGVHIARSGFLPKLFFQTDYSYLGQRNDLKFAQKDFSKGFTSAISLQIPLFNGFKSVQEYQQAKLDYRIMQDNEKQLNDMITAEVEVAYNNFNEARQKYESAKETVALAEEALRMANLMYNEGANTQLDVLVSRLALTQSQVNYFSSIYEYQAARYYLRKATGKTQLD